MPTLRYGQFLTVISLSVFLSACAPGYSIETVSQTSSAIVLEYTHSVGGELQAVIQEAEKRCAQYGKHARMASQGPIKLNVDRSVVTFDCVN